MSCFSDEREHNTWTYCKILISSCRRQNPEYWQCLPAAPTYPEATAGATLLPAFAQCGTSSLPLRCLMQVMPVRPNRLMALTHTVYEIADCADMFTCSFNLNTRAKSCLLPELLIVWNRRKPTSQLNCQCEFSGPVRGRAMPRGVYLPVSGCHLLSL